MWASFVGIGEIKFAEAGNLLRPPAAPKGAGQWERFARCL